MKNCLRRALVLFFLFAASPGWAQIVGQTDDPMVIGGGARPLGMGRAFCAVADDADAPFINPAGIAGLKGPQVMSMFTNLMGEVYYTEFCGAVPASFGTVGVGYISTGVNDIPTEVGGQIVNTNYYDSLLVVAYSTPLARFFGYGRRVFVGTNLKIFSRGWSGGINESAVGFSADLGVKFVLSPYLSFGVSRQNFLPFSLGGVLHWNSGAEEAIASITKIGVAARPMQFDGRLLLAFDMDLPEQHSRPTTLHLGGEWELHRNMVLRAGFDQSVDAGEASGTSWNPTYGFSLNNAGFRVDYAYHPYYNDAALATSYVSLSYQWEPRFALEGEIKK
jgi:hypothetical protein